VKKNDKAKAGNPGRNDPSLIHRARKWWCSLPRALQVAIVVAVIGFLGAVCGPVGNHLADKWITRLFAARPPTPTPTSTLGPCHTPQLVADLLRYTLNGNSGTVQREDSIQVAPGDQLCMASLKYHTDGTPGPSDTATGEVYIRKHEPDPISCDDGFDQYDGRFWLGDPVDPGANELTKIDPKSGGCWTIEAGWDRLVVALVHNGTFGWEVDHRFFVQLVPR